MKAQDLIIISVDDQIVEPPTMYDQHLSVQRRALKPELRKDKNRVNY